MRTIRITGNGPAAHNHKIFLDDVDISRFVTDITVQLRRGMLDTVHLTLVGWVELPDELKALVTAERPEPTPPEFWEAGEQTEEHENPLTWTWRDKTLIAEAKP